MIGASLNGLHRNFTTIVRLPDLAAEAVRTRMNEEWERAIKVEPKTLKNPPSATVTAPEDEGAVVSGAAETQDS